MKNPAESVEDERDMLFTAPLLFRTERGEVWNSHKSVICRVRI